MPTAIQQLADHLLDGQLEAFVRDRRAKGESWRRISLDLRDAVKVDVTHETLRSWYPDSTDAATADVA